MRFVLEQLLKAALRIEKKLDELLRLSVTSADQGKAPGSLPTMVTPMSAPHQVCPACNHKVMYMQVQLPPPMDRPVVIRKCECKPADALPVGEINA